MAALASCAPSTVVANPTSSILSVNSFVFFSGNALKILFALLNATPIGSISVAPTPAPSREAFVRSSCVAPASLANTLASPAPAPTANAPAAGIPTPGIKDVPRIPVKEPRASPNLRGIACSSPVSGVTKL